MRPNHFKAYIDETGYKHMVEDEHGFATYMFLADSVYIEDIYVVPEKRQLSQASQYADTIATIAKQHGFLKLTGTVNLQSKTSHKGLLALLNYGFKPTLAQNNIIYLNKDL